MQVLAEKNKPYARHSMRSICSRSPRTHSTVQLGLRISHWFTRGRASATARWSNSQKLRRCPDMARHTVISASTRAGMICAVIRVSTESSPQPRRPVSNSSLKRENVQCPTSNANAEISETFCTHVSIRHWTLSVGRWTFLPLDEFQLDSALLTAAGGVDAGKGQEIDHPKAFRASIVGRQR